MEIIDAIKKITDLSNSNDSDNKKLAIELATSNELPVHLFTGAFDAYQDKRERVYSQLQKAVTEKFMPFVCDGLDKMGLRSITVCVQDEVFTGEDRVCFPEENPDSRYESNENYHFRILLEDGVWTYAGVKREYTGYSFKFVEKNARMPIDSLVKRTYCVHFVKAVCRSMEEAIKKYSQKLNEAECLLNNLNNFFGNNE